MMMMTFFLSFPLMFLFSVQVALHCALPLSDLFRVRRGSHPDVPGQGHTSPFQSAYCGEIFPLTAGRPQSTGRLHMPLWTDATAVPHGSVKRTSCPFGRPDSAQCSSSRRNASGGVKTSSPRRQEISSTKACGKNLRV